MSLSGFAFAGPAHLADHQKYHTNATKACEHYTANHTEYKGCLGGFHLAMPTHNHAHFKAGFKACHREKDLAKWVFCPIVTTDSGLS